MTYREISSKLGISTATIVKHCKGITSNKEAGRIRSEKNIPITDETREKQSSAAVKRIIKTKKIWTSPEKKFFYKLIELGYVIRFSENIEKLHNINYEASDVVDFIFQGEVQRYSIDFLDIKNNICYEINGNYWHANPKIYKEESLTDAQKFNVYRDKNKKIYLESKGYKVITIWEDDIADVVLENKNYKHTDNYVEYIKFCIDAMSKIKSSPMKIKVIVPNKCVDCGADITKQSERCRKCSNVDLSNKQDKNRKVKVSKEELEFLVDNFSFREIGRKFGVTDNTIRKRCKTFDIDTHKHKRGTWVKGPNIKSRKFHTTKEELENLINSGTSWAEMERIFGVKETSIKNRAKSFGILFTINRNFVPNKLEKLTKEEFIRLNVNENKSVSEMSSIFNVTDQSIKRRAKKLGITIRKVYKGG